MKTELEIKNRLEAFRVDRDHAEEAWLNDQPYASSFGRQVQDLDARIEELEWVLGVKPPEPAIQDLRDALERIPKVA